MPGYTNKKSIILGILIAVVAVIALVTGLVIYRNRQDPYHGQIAPGVSAGGFDLSGLSKKDAKKSLQNKLEETIYSHSLVIELPDGNVELRPEDTGVNVNIDGLIDAAYQMGRIDYNTGDLLLGPYISFKREPIREILQSYADRYTGTAQETAYEIVGGLPDLATDRVDPAQLTLELEITLGIQEVCLELDPIIQQIPDAYADAIRLIEEERYSISAEPVVVFTPMIPNAWQLRRHYTREPVNDTLDPDTLELIPGSYGYTLDEQETENMLKNTAPGEVIRVQLNLIAPEFIGVESFFRDVLGSCETRHVMDQNRNQNLNIVCEVLNGMVIQPGETFSYNDSLGERTADKGYKAAPAYSGDRLIDTLGGGICQGSSTLYNCVLEADLQVVERVCHGAAVSYLPYGLDAAVSWGFSDLKFTNIFHYPIMIQAEDSGTMLSMKILGIDEKDYYVKMTVNSDSSQEGVVYAVSYKNKYDKETNELISKDREAFSTYYSLGN